MNVHKTIICVLLGILMSSPVVAQEMSVTEFKLLNTDLTANTRGTSKMDQNGEWLSLEWHLFLQE